MRIMLAKLVTETKNIVVTAVEGADDILDALRGAVKNQIVNTLKDIKEIGTTGLDAVASVVTGAVE